MDFGLAFSYVFKDQDWFKKVAITGLITLIPIVGQMYLLGWGLEVTRRVIQGEQSPLLPDTDFGAYLGKGFSAFIIALVYSLPSIIFSSIQSIVNVAASAAANGSDNATGAATAVVMVVTICVSILSIIYSLALAVFLPAAYGKFVSTGSLGSAFKIGEIFGLIKAAPGAYIMAFLGTMVAGLVGGLGVIACVIGLLITYPYYALVMSHFVGQAYNQAVHNQPKAPSPFPQY